MLLITKEVTFMDKEQTITKVTIEYKNDIDAMNKLIDLIIYFLLDNNESAGVEIGGRGETLYIGGIGELSTYQ
jgi:hypothetical protein